MIIIGNTLISDEIITERFVCDLPVCHGGCCIEGDAGAPLLKSETGILESIFPKLRPFLEKAGVRAIEANGTWVTDPAGEPVTPLVEGGPCAYVFYDEKGVAGCGIEKAYEQGHTDFRKPISCHLYPIRITCYSHYDALNYHRWHLCDCARKKGKQLGLPVYRFLKEPLIRKYGEQWYEELTAWLDYSGQTGQKNNQSE